MVILFFLVCLPWGVTATENANTATKLLALTFDDGPGQYTAELLDALNAKGAKATFFLVGSRVAANADLVRREYDEGHQVASHSWNHPKLTSLSGDALAAQLNDTANAISAITGTSGFYLRPPYGSYNSTVQSYAGAPLILWSVDTLDWKYRNAETVTNNIVNGAKDGAIILLHDIHETSVQGAIAAIDILQSQGYELVTVAELLTRRGITPTAGTVYSSAASSSPADETEATEAAPVTEAPNPAGADFDETKLDSHWAYNDICFVQERDIMQGTGDNEFSPNKYITRAMFVTVLSRIYGGDISGFTNDFTDVAAGSYYEDSVAWAAANDIVQGNDDASFAPEEFITREQMSVILSRYADFAQLKLKAKNAKSAFSDDAEISQYAKSAVYALAQSGVLAGSGSGEFAPQAKATRAETAKICHVFVRDFVDAKAIMETIKDTLSHYSVPRLV